MKQVDLNRLFVFLFIFSSKKKTYYFHPKHFLYFSAILFFLSLISWNECEYDFIKNNYDGSQMDIAGNYFVTYLPFTVIKNRRSISRLHLLFPIYLYFLVMWVFRLDVIFVCFSYILRETLVIFEIYLFLFDKYIDFFFYFLSLNESLLRSWTVQIFWYEHCEM